jgi:adenosylhomocysteinase
MIADIKLVDHGRKEIAIAETEMPAHGHRRYAKSQPLKGAHAGSLHMTIQTAVLMDTPKSLGLRVLGLRVTSIRPRITQRPRSPQLARRCSPSRARAEGLLGVYPPIFEWADGGTPNMILTTAATPPC